MNENELNAIPMLGCDSHLLVFQPLCGNNVTSATSHPTKFRSLQRQHSCHSTENFRKNSPILPRQKNHPINYSQIVDTTLLCAAALPAEQVHGCQSNFVKLCTGSSLSDQHSTLPVL